ncbi:glucose-methanol-choline oxidoreductase [Mycena vulgaris]|nr:glucose-methanol-choline oxidoreductase [Mycena vulgaris]
MKPRDQMGVVDPQFDVCGVKNLKIADLSIAPLNVGANTYNTALNLIIGEKAAVIIAEELGINGVQNFRCQVWLG